MISGYVDTFAWGLQNSTLGEQTAESDESRPFGDWFYNLDFSGVPTEDEVLNLPFLDELPCLGGTDLVGAASLIWQSTETDSKKHEEIEDLGTWKYEIEPPLSPSRSSNNHNADSPGCLGQSSPLSDEAPENPQKDCGMTGGHSDSAFCTGQSSPVSPTDETPAILQTDVGIDTRSCQEKQKADADMKAQIDPSHKKKMRLLRNRELAFESRQRKKSYVKDLELKCKMLEQQRNQLQQQVCLSSTENAVLKEEIFRLKKLKGSNGVPEPAVLLKDSLPLEFRLHLTFLSLLAWLSSLVSPYLALIVGEVLLRSLDGLSKGQVESKGYPIPSRIGSFLIVRWNPHFSTSSTKQCFFSFWRRRSRHMIGYARRIPTILGGGGGA